MAKAKKTGAQQPRAGNGGTIPPEEHRFKPGVSGNPNGRPKSKPIADALRKLGAEQIEVQADNKQLKGKREELLAEVAYRRALSGDFRYFKELMDRTEGKVPDRVDVTSGDEPLPGLSKAELELLAKGKEGPG